MPTTRLHPPNPRDEVDDIRVDFAKCFGSPHGQRVLAHLEKRYFVHAPIITVAQDGTGRIDPERVIYCEAQRAVILDIARSASLGADGEKLPDKGEE
uniref:Bbp19-like phage domain-containing protein n=1 Tax=viral metagenome TaxID=1070528 RepID=A0A6H1ZEP5_9ZZZZ